MARTLRGAGLVLVSWFCASPLHAATYYLATTGSDGNSCMASQTIGTPKQHFMGASGALACLASGDVLEVRAGTYPERLLNPTIASGTSWLVKTLITAYNGETVWVETVSDVALQLTGTYSYIEFYGINFHSAAAGSTIYFGGSTHHMRVANGEIYNSSEPGGTGQIAGDTNNSEYINLTVHGHGGPVGFYLGGDGNLIDGCHIYDGWSTGIQIFAGGFNPTGTIVRNCRIHDIHHASFFGTPDNRIRGIIITGTNNQVYNNLIYDLGFIDGTPPAGSTAGIYIWTGVGHLVANNTVVGNTVYGILVDAASNTAVTNNIAYGNTGTTDIGATVTNYRDTGGGTQPLTNLFGVDPVFVSTTDFHLQAVSPAVDVGTTVAAVTYDYDHHVRPEGMYYDIGAYEFFVPNPPVPPGPTTEPQKYKITFRATTP